MSESAKPAAIMGSLVNLKNVSTHKSLALTIHVPAEAAQQVLAAFGWPTMVDPVPVAVARLEEVAAQAEPAPKDVLQTLEETGEKANRKLQASIAGQLRHLNAMDKAISEELHSPRHWPDLAPAQQTGIVRNEPTFWECVGVNDAEAARNYIRWWCGVNSCADIHPGTEAAAKWAQLQVRYGNWLSRKGGLRTA
jgi:hypothetical protein